ncbi:MAG TPA: hypothetical protein VFN39_06015 [Gemmatimonadaceae bacterium]|nr:hypothetical protein [Gemmatimonadaceae bacterium]
MAPWQVIFHVVPHRAMASAPRVLDAAIVATTDWWGAGTGTRELRDRLGVLVGQPTRTTPTVESWGTADGNGVDVHLSGGKIARVIAHVDVRKLDPKFGAALLGLARSMQSVLVRADGWVTEPTVGGYSGALRGDPAWAHANEPKPPKIATEAEEEEDA